MIYLKKFRLPGEQIENSIASSLDPRRPRNSTYPLGIFTKKELEEINFGDITLIYGGNGSGKSTLLKIIAKKLGATLKRDFNKGVYFDEYIMSTNREMIFDKPLEIKMISSDDVFDNILDIRAINTGINRNKEKLLNEYIENRYHNKEADITNFEEVKAILEPKSKTPTQYIRERISNMDIVEYSNGESALLFWEQEIKEKSIYILDEPENSLSAENQMKLAKFIEESARFYDCQFIISTHSPFLLSLRGAKIYDLDSVPVKEKKWTELANIKIYYDFFKEHESEFDD